jgi:hypothetical protein
MRKHRPGGEPLSGFLPRPRQISAVLYIPLLKGRIFSAEEPDWNKKSLDLGIAEVGHHNAPAWGLPGKQADGAACHLVGQPRQRVGACNAGRRLTAGLGLAWQC